MEEIQVARKPEPQGEEPEESGQENKNGAAHGIGIERQGKRYEQCTGKLQPAAPGVPHGERLRGEVNESGGGEKGAPVTVVRREKIVLEIRCPAASSSSGPGPIKSAYNNRFPSISRTLSPNDSSAPILRWFKPRQYSLKYRRKRLRLHLSWVPVCVRFKLSHRLSMPLAGSFSRATRGKVFPARRTLGIWRCCCWICRIPVVDRPVNGTAGAGSTYG